MQLHTISNLALLLKQPFQSIRGRYEVIQTPSYRLLKRHQGNLCDQYACQSGLQTQAALKR